MSYNVTHYSGTIVTVLANNTVDNTTTPINLVGKNSLNYGTVQNDNFIYLLENFANSIEPLSKFPGQTWWDLSVNRLKLYDRNGWRGLATIQYDNTSTRVINGTPHLANVPGDFWFNTATQQLSIFTGSAFTVIGPETVPGYGITRAQSTTILDVSNNPHPVVELNVNGQTQAVVSSDYFTPAVGQLPSQFVAIQTGTTFVNNVIVDTGYLGIGTTTPRTNLDVVSSATYITSPSGQPAALEITSNAGTPGIASLELSQSATGIAGILNKSNSLLQLGANNSYSLYVSATGMVGINQPSPTAMLHIQSLSTATGLDIEKTGGILPDITIYRSSPGTSAGSGPSLVLGDRNTPTQELLIQNSLGSLTFWNYRSSSWQESARLNSNGSLLINTTTVTTVGDETLVNNGNLASGSIFRTGLGVGSQDSGLEISYYRSTDGNSYIDLHSSSGSDYDARLIKSAGVNGAFSIINTGTGQLVMNPIGGDLVSILGSTERARILNTTGEFLIGTSSNLGYAGSKLIVQTNDATGTVPSIISASNSFNRSLQIVHDNSGTNINFGETSGFTNVYELKFQTKTGVSTFTPKMIIAGTTGNLLINKTTDNLAQAQVGGILTANETSMMGVSYFDNGTALSKYRLLMILPASTGGTYDHASIVAAVNDGWSASSTSILKLMVGNRNGFAAKSEWTGSIRTFAGIRAFQQTDGTTQVYAYATPSAFATISIQVQSSVNVTLTPNSPTLTATPTGTLVYDSTLSVVTSPLSNPFYYAADTGNFIIGGTSDTGYKLQVSGTGSMSGILTLPRVATTSADNELSAGSISQFLVTPGSGNINSYKAGLAQVSAALTQYSGNPFLKNPYYIDPSIVYGSGDGTVTIGSSYLNQSANTTLWVDNANTNPYASAGNVAQGYYDDAGTGGVGAFHPGNVLYPIYSGSEGQSITPDLKWQTFIIPTSSIPTGYQNVILQGALISDNSPIAIRVRTNTSGIGVLLAYTAATGSNDIVWLTNKVILPLYFSSPSTASFQYAFWTQVHGGIRQWDLRIVGYS